MALSGSSPTGKEKLEEDKFDSSKYFYAAASIPGIDAPKLAGTHVIVLISLPNGLNGTTQEKEKIAKEDELFTSVLDLFKEYMNELKRLQLDPFTLTFVLGAGGTQKALDFTQEELKAIFQKYRGEEDLPNFFHRQVIPYAEEKERAMRETYERRVQEIKAIYPNLSIPFRILGWEEACGELKNYPEEITRFKARYAEDEAFRTEVNFTRDNYLSRHKEKKDERITMLGKTLETHCPEVFSKIKNVEGFIRECGAYHILLENAYLASHASQEASGKKTIFLYNKKFFEEGFKTVFTENEDNIEAHWLKFKSILASNLTKNPVGLGVPIYISDKRLQAAKDASLNKGRAAHGLFDNKNKHKNNIDEDKNPQPEKKPKSSLRKVKFTLTPTTAGFVSEVLKIIQEPEEREVDKTKVYEKTLNSLRRTPT